MSASGERRNDPGPPEEVCNFGLAGKQNANSATWPVTAGAGLVKALARAFRWKRMLESGDFVTIKELADREGIAVSYLTRVLRLTLLAPDIVEAILDGTQEPDVTL